MSSENVERLVKTVRLAKSDNEQLAALFMVAQCLKGEEVDSEARHRIFSAIGFNFISRLISTKNKSSDENEILFRSIGISILSTFCTDREMATCPDMLKNLPLFGELITSIPQAADMRFEERSIVEDCYDCLVCIADSRAGRRAMSEANTLLSLLTATTKHCFGYQRALKLLSFLARCHDNSEKLEDSKAESYLMVLVEDFCSNKNEEKFVIATVLIDFISVYCTLDVLLKVSDGVFWKPVCTSMWEILSSRLYESQRSIVLTLISELVKVYGLKWFLEQGVNTRQLLLLLRLACVEIQMILDECDVNEVEIERQMTVMACCVVLEEIQNILDIDTTLELDMSHLEQIGGSLMSAIRSILSFIQYQYDTYVAPASPDDAMICKMRPVFCACIRLIGSWASDEESARNKEFTNCLPAIVSICEKLCPQYSNQGAGARKPLSQVTAHGSERNLDNEAQPVASSKQRTVTFSACEELAVGDEEQRSTEPVDLLSFVLPALVHSTCLSSVRIDLMTNNLTSLLVNYLSWKLSVRKSSVTSQSSVDEEIIQACVVLGNYLNDAALKADVLLNELLQPLLSALSHPGDHDIPTDVLGQVENILCLFIISTTDVTSYQEIKSKLISVSRSYDMKRLEGSLMNK